MSERGAGWRVAVAALLLAGCQNELFRDAGVPAPRCSFAHVTVNGEDLGLVIGRRGQTIDAIQHLATRIVQRDAGDGERGIGSESCSHHRCTRQPPRYVSTR